MMYIVRVNWYIARQIFLRMYNDEVGDGEINTKILPSQNWVNMLITESCGNEAALISDLLQTPGSAICLWDKKSF